MKVRNVHERMVTTNRVRATEVFDSVATKKDKLWPRGKWPALRLDKPKDQNGRGGHGPVRYKVTDYEPGARIAFQFENKGLSTGLNGTHYFELYQSGESKFLARHVIEADLGWPAFMTWPFIIRPLHDALIEDALDNFERETTDAVQQANRYSIYVRALRKLLPGR